jgi:hypothetical protein
MTPTLEEQPPVEDDSAATATLAAKPESAEVKPDVPESPPPESILVIDVGGSKVKLLVSGQTEPRKQVSGTKMTPGRLVQAVQELTQDWTYDAISIGYPGLVGSSGPRSEPGNLGPGWVGFDYSAALGKPVRIINDAAMQALGSYEGGRMLFLGLGTGLGSALIVRNVLITLELGCLPFAGGQTLSDVLGKKGLERLGKKSWRAIIADVVPKLMGAFVADDVVIGGGNAKEVKVLPPGARLGHNLTAFRGGFRLWHVDDVPTQSQDGGLPDAARQPAEWRLI